MSTSKTYQQSLADAGSENRPPMLERAHDMISTFFPDEIYKFLWMLALRQFEKLVNTSRAKKLEKSHDPLALVAHTGSSSRQTSSYYVTHPTFVVNYDDEYQQDDVHNILKSSRSGLILERQKAKEVEGQKIDCLKANLTRNTVAIMVGSPDEVFERNKYYINCMFRIPVPVRPRDQTIIMLMSSEGFSLTIDEVKLRKMADEMLRQRCTSGDEHQYYIDHMKNLLKSDIVWESRKEILKGNSGPEKIVLSLHKFPAIIFNDDDIEEQTSRWVNKSVKEFNPYAQYGVEHWKNPHAKIFYIRKQKEPGKPKEEIYSNSKIVQVIKTYWELGHEHKFITEIVARRANDCIVSITEPDFKNLNKNDIEDIYFLIMNGKIPDYADTRLLWSLSVFIRSSVIWERVHDFQLGIESYQQKVNLTAPTITFPGIEEHDMFSIIYEPVHGIIYKNSKKEKRVMRHTEIHKFCDATLNRELEEEIEASKAYEKMGDVREWKTTWIKKRTP
ncbi:hypothetical protein Tco_0340258 [Tanacetum coccineum]